MQYIIDFDDSIGIAEIQDYFNRYNCEVLQTYSSFEKVFLIEAVSQPVKESFVTSVINNQETVITPLIYDSQSTVTVDLQADNDWWKTVSIRDVDLTKPSATFLRRGNFSVVYIVDSGINSVHPEFVDATVTNLYSFNDDFQDYNGHGTAIASVISGQTCGMTSAKLKSVKIFQEGVDTYQSHILAALDAIYQDVLANPNQFSIINISWSVPKNEYIEGKIRKLLLANIWVVCAAGNNGQTVENLTPAGMPETYTVGAYNRELEPCVFSNHPSAISNTPLPSNVGQLWVWAPGENIRAAYKDTVDMVAGTSIASAIASAALAYNSWNLVKDNGEFPIYQSKIHDYVPGISFGNIDFLNLPPEYTNVYNCGCNFNVYKINEASNMHFPAEHSNVLVKSGEKFQVLILDPMYDKQILSITELPQGVQVIDNCVEGTVVTDSYLTKLIKIYVESLLGNVREKHIYLYVTSEQYTLETIPEEDQLMAIDLLLASCCYGVTNIGCRPGTQCANCFNCGDKLIPQCIDNCFTGPCGQEVCP